MPKTRKKPTPPPPGRTGYPPVPPPNKANPGPQDKLRWQRTKRYGWDSR